MVEYGRALATTTAMAMVLEGTAVTAVEVRAQGKEELAEDSDPPKLQAQDITEAQAVAVAPPEAHPVVRATTWA